MRTVADYIERLKEFPPDWPVVIATPAGGGIAVEHREIRGIPVVAVFGRNGGCFGENPLTEEEYEKQSRDFLERRQDGRKYTSIHGDHRLYDASVGPNATCYGKSYDPRIVQRMVDEGLINASDVDLACVGKLSGLLT